jgi:hypothetical protein
VVDLARGGRLRQGTVGKGAALSGQLKFNGVA